MNERVVDLGKKLPFGVVEPLPLRGFPEGKKRIRMRNDGFVRVYVRAPGKSTRAFLPAERDGAWWPAIKIGANERVDP